ncbi:MAG TPA: sugar phosphate nucleotidyltransferase [Verrucomicrobiae bacterium]|jgi:UTP-glucose-1-phosphate uridylyltransferase
MTKPTLLVLAAGMGSRYGGLKQIEPVGPNGETIIDFSVFDALRAGFGRLVFVIRRDIETQFKEIVGSRFTGKIPVEYAYQELNQLPAGYSVPAGRTKPWGTGHAILAAAEVIREPFAVINADDFYGPNSLRILADHLRSGTNDYAMVGYTLRNTLSDFGTVSRGVCETDANGFLKSITELTKIERSGDRAQSIAPDGNTIELTGDEIVSLNLWGFTPGFFAHLRELFAEFLKQYGHEQTAEFYLPAAVNSLIASGTERCRVLKTPDSWLGVTYREDRSAVVAGINLLIAQDVYPQPL